MKPFCRNRIFLASATLVLVCSSAPVAQQVRRRNTSPPPATSNTVNLGGELIGTTVTTGTMSVSSGRTFIWTGGGPVAETRTSDGPMPTLQQVKLSAHVIPATALAPATYLKMAMRVRLDSAATDEARLIDAIHQIDLKVYDYDRVDGYLYRQALKQGTNVRWVWKPMRDEDKEITDTAAGEFNWQVTSGFGMLFSKLYGKAIPARVLETVANVMAKVPDAVFLVSDYEVVKPDPFLAVTTKKLLDQNKIWIIDVWAEPGFTDSVPEMKVGPSSML